MNFFLRMLRPLSLALVVTQCLALAQTVDTAKSIVHSQSAFSDAIEDNSFLIEEAYNQEPGVVQHISTGVYFTKPHNDFQYGFTQEWPLAGQTHQLSFTIPYSFKNESNSPGLGDVLLNYRYQLFSASNWAAVAPRFSLIIPSGSVSRGSGSGSIGFQVAVPVSKRFSEFFVVHLNASATMFPRAKGTTATGSEVRRTVSTFSFGGSLILLATKHLDFLLEVLGSSIGEIDGSGDAVHTKEVILNPGLRAAVDLGNLQIVPGIGIPVSFLEGSRRTGLFFYLSFEHPF